MKAICVYCGSNAGSRPAYAERAAALGERIAREGLALVYGGGNVGLMGLAADAALAAGGEVIGVIPEQLVTWEVAHKGVSRLEVVANMHERKMRMFDLADAFVALPGGFGTLDEMFEMLTWRQPVPACRATPRPVAWRGHRRDAGMDARLQPCRRVQVDRREKAQHAALIHQIRQVEGQTNM